MFYKMFIIKKISLSPRNIPKPSESILSHLVHDRRHAYAYSYIFVPYPFFSRHSTRTSINKYNKYVFDLIGIIYKLIMIKDEIHKLSDWHLSLGQGV